MKITKPCNYTTNVYTCVISLAKSNNSLLFITKYISLVPKQDTANILQFKKVSIFRFDSIR